MIAGARGLSYGPNFQETARSPVGACDIQLIWVDRASWWHSQARGPTKGDTYDDDAWASARSYIQSGR